jgi:gas vesicle protein
MTEESKKGFGAAGVIATFVGGAICGGVAALLLAPKSGKETRRMIGETIERQKDRVTRLGTAARDAKEAFAEAMTAESH